MDRDTAVRTWRDVCGNDTVMAMGVVTWRMLEEFAARIEAAERERWQARVEQAFREGYWARETYNDSEVSDADEKWASAKAGLLGA